MKLRERLREIVRSFSTEVLAIWFAFRDRRVRWYVKVFLVLPIAYVVSPFDLLRDSVLILGQIDDLVVLRMSYFLITKFLDPAVLTDCRERASQFLAQGKTNRAAFAVAVTAVWGVTIFLGLQYLIKRFLRHA